MKEVQLDDGNATVWVDNELVMKNFPIPESKLKKMHIAICYHLVSEASAARILKIFHIKSEDRRE